MKKRVLRIPLGTRQLLVYPGTAVSAQRREWDAQRHSNGDYELHVLLEGSCRVELADGEHLLQAGEAVLIPPGCYHCAKSRPGPFARFSVSFTGLAPEQLPTQSRVFPGTDALLQTCRDIHGELDYGGEMGTEMLTACFARLLILLCRAVSDGTAEQEAREPAGEHWRAAVIDDFFEKHRDAYGTKATLAVALNLSERQLERVLLKQYGMSFRQKLTQSRMDYAAWLLRTGDRSITEIQSLAGYASQSTFYHAFEKTWGMTPGQYRQKSNGIKSIGI